MMRLLLILPLLLTLVSGCETRKTEEPEPPVGKLELKKTEFDALTGWKKDDMKEAYHAFMKSCDRILAFHAEFIGKGKIKIPTRDYQELCLRAAEISPANFKKFLENNFIPYAVFYQGNENGKFTAYYEAEIHASKKKSDKYKFPVYGIPEDLVEFNPRDFDASLPSKNLVGRVENQRLVPYYTREEIHEDSFKAPVILWADSSVDVYLMQIQGSAVAWLDDGTSVRVGYAASNGRPFRGIGSILLENKLLSPGQASMGQIKKWLKENPDIALKQMNKNQRYIFHKLNYQDGAIGALGVPLTAGRSLAVDPEFIPLGSLLWLETTLPGNKPLQRLVNAQDIGGAIKGGVRGDYFYGSGNDEVLEQAGKMNSVGKYFILLPKTMKVENNEK